MTIPRQTNEFLQERLVVPVEHAQQTASFGAHVLNAVRQLRVDHARYYNPTGLAAHSSNAFALTLAKTEPLVVADKVFTAANATEILTSAAHGLQTGDGPVRVSNAGGGLPGGLAAATDYWIIRLSADTFQFAASREGALAGTVVLLSSDGTGTQTLSDTADTKRLVTLASGIDTDSDTGAAIPPSKAVALTMNDEAVIEAGEDLYLVGTEGGSATLPAGRLVVDGRYLT